MKNSMLMILAGVASVCIARSAVPAPRTEPPPVVPVRPAPIRPVDLRPDEQPLILREYSVAARVSGVFATVQTVLVVGNPNRRALEGALDFPLPAGASVCGYALDVNGEMVDGVVVPKEKARVAFEAEVARGADPGLVEHVGGNAYRTRIYPIPANGSRRIRIEYVTPLAFGATGDAALVLAMPRVPMGERNVSIVVPIGGGVPDPVLGGLGDRRFARAEAVWRTVSSDRNVVPDEDVVVALPARAETLVAVERRQNEYWFAVSEKTPDLQTARTSLPTAWRILWDASGSRSEADIKAALALVGKLPESACYELIEFRNRAEKPRICATRGELVAVLESLAYDGGTDLAALAAMHRNEACENRTLLFTDGMDVLSEDEPDFGANKPIGIVSGAVKDGELLRRICGGRVIDLSVRSPEQALAEIAAPPPTLEGVSGAGTANLQGIGQVARGRVTVLGRLEAEEAEIVLAYGLGRRSAPVRIRKADAREGRTLATAWAAGRVNELSARAEEHAEELLAIGRRYGLASPATSLIVFETLDQWLAYDVEPPESLAELHREWTSRRPSAAQRRAAEERRVASYFSRLKSEWLARVDWWNNPIPKQPKSPKSGLFGALFGGSSADGARPPALMCVAADAVPVDGAASAGVGNAPPRSAGASISVTAWDPDTPYLLAIKDAGKALGATGATLYGEYMVQRRKHAASPAFFLDCAGYFFGRGERDLAVRILSNLAELRLADAGLLRTFAWRLREAGEYDLALRILRKILKMRAEDPQGPRDLAIVYEERGRLRKDAADIEAALRCYHQAAFTAWKKDNGIWTSLIAIEELNGLLAWSERQKWEGKAPAAPEFEAVYRNLLDLDVRIAMEWDVDNTDIDLHVLEPDGEEAYYRHPRTSTGGFMTHDVVTGYGPEEYLKKKAPAGTYRILVNYFGSRQQTLLGPATVTATVYTNWGRADEKRRTLSMRLEKVKDKLPVGEVRIDP
ncbi:MAG: VIT domain-containing protein [Kiritimatiellia bacterium]